jgi:acyl-CoA thioester hydrolase
MYIHQTQLRVRYGETDKMGYLYYGHYAEYFEVGRVECMRSLGMSYREMEDDHHMIMPVMSLNVRYLRPLYYDDLVSIETKIKELPSQTIIFESNIINPNGKLSTSGQVMLCFLDAATKKRISAPSVIVDRLKEYFV